MNQPRDLVSRFAKSLDDEDYAVTAALLSEGCRYESPTGEIIGPRGIVESYKGNGDSANDRFDLVLYDHSITEIGGGWFQIEFVDDLQLRDARHVYRCRQRVSVLDGEIDAIIHEEIRGQRESLNRWLEEMAAG